MESIYLTGGMLVVIAVFAIAARIPSLRMPKGFNSTAEWTPVPEFEHASDSSEGSLSESWLAIITPHLEGDETLEGYARAAFNPPRPQDWSFAASRFPLLIAVTSRRLLMFELNRHLILTRYRFVDYGDIRYLRPPKPGFFGAKGKMRFGLDSGREYQLTFLGPIVDAECLQQESRLAAFLCRAPRLATPRVARLRAA